MIAVQGAVRPLAAGIGPLALPGEEGFRWAAASRFTAVQPAVSRRGLDPRALDGSARRGIVTLCRRLGLSLAGLDLSVPAPAWLDESRIGRAIELANDATGLAEDLGRLPVSIDVQSPDSVPQQARAELIATAERRGVRIVVYSEGPCVWGEWVTRGIDAAQCAASGADPVNELIRCGARLGGVRLRPPGEGQGSGSDAPRPRVDLQGVAAALAGVGFTGFPVGQVNGGQSAQGDLIRIRSLWEAQP